MGRTHTPTPWSVQIVNPESAEIVGGDGATSVADYLTPDDAEHIVHCVHSHDGLVEALRDLVALREYGDEADVLRADMSGPDGLLPWADVEQRVWANARRALEAAGIKTTEGT
jgi:hypothetical protein